MKHRIALVLVVIAIVAFGVVLSGKVSTRLDKLDSVAAEAAQKASSRPAKPAPEVVQPQAGPTSETIHVTGTLRPEAEVELGFKLPGRVVELLAQRGDSVQAGQALANLNGSDIEAQAAQARAGMQAARAQREMAADSLRRSRNLQEAGAASEQQVMMAGNQTHLGEASLAQATASSRLIDSLRQETRLVTPIDGVVVRAPSAAGFFAAPGVPIFRVEKLTSLRFSGHLGDSEAGRVAKGSRLVVKSESGAEAVGKLELIIPSVDPMTRRVPIEGLVPNADGKLFAGSFVTATIEATAEPSLRIPATALVTGETPAVLVVGDTGVLQRRQVQVLRSEKEHLFVKSGLQPTDRVIANPGTTWREGDRLAK